MKTSKKIFAAVLAAATAVSAMGVTVFAEEKPEIGSYAKTDDYIISVLDENLDMVYYDREDVEALDGKIDGVFGTVYVNLNPESKLSGVMPIFQGDINLTRVPTSSHSMANETDYFGRFGGYDGTRYSNYRLTDLSGNWRFALETFSSLAAGQSVQSVFWINANLSGVSRDYDFATLNLYQDEQLIDTTIRFNTPINYGYISVATSFNAPHGICYLEK